MRVFSYLELARPVDGLMAAFAVLVGFVVGMGGFGMTLLLAMASVFIFSSAGIVLNDYFDFEMDKVNAPTRPLPTGKVKRESALYYSISLFVLAVAIAFFINAYCFGLALLNTVLEVLYAWKFKRIALLGNFTDSWFPASSFLYGAFAAGSLASVPLLALLAFLANTGREIYGDLEDLEGDRKQGAKTLPIMAGENMARASANIFILAAVALSFAPWALGLLNFYYLALVAVADTVFVLSMFFPPKKNQFLTKLAMVIAMAAFVMGVV